MGVNSIQIRKNGKQIIEPHVWHNPINTIKMVEIINSSLVKLAPENKNIYNKNTKKVTKEINQINSWIKGRLASIPDKNRKLVTTNSKRSLGMGPMMFCASCKTIRWPKAKEGIDVCPI